MTVGAENIIKLFIIVMIKWNERMNKIAIQFQAGMILISYFNELFDFRTS